VSFISVRRLALLLALIIPARLACQNIRSLPLNQLEDRALRDSCDPRALYELAIGHLSHEHYATADSLLRVTLSLDPEFAEALYALSVVRNRDDGFWNALRRTGGDTAVAAERLRRAAATRHAFLIDPFVNVTVLGGVLRRQDFREGRSIPLAALMAFDYGNAFYWIDADFRDYATRLPSYDSFPPNLLWLHGLGAARTGDYQKSVADFEALLHQASAHERGDTAYAMLLSANEIRYMLAGLQLRLHHNTVAIQLYQTVLANDIGNYMAHVQLARIYESEHGWRDAVRERQAAVELNPDDHTLLYELGVALSGAERWQEAEIPLGRAVTLQPRFASGHLALGIAQQKAGKTAEARISFDHFIAIAPQREHAAVEDARRRLGELGSP
jgi:Tfp pilus assembly protein PilF